MARVFQDAEYSTKAIAEFRRFGALTTTSGANKVYNMTVEQECILLRNRYAPSDIKVVFVLESPPQGHGYFYNPEGRVSEVLFRAFMKLIDFVPITKDEGLKKLADRGYILVNPVYIPVNKLPDREADAIILRNYPKFLDDLNGLLKRNKNTPIILVKSNIFRLLEMGLREKTDTGKQRQ